MLKSSKTGMKEAQKGHQWGAHANHSFMDRGMFAHQSDGSHTKTEGLTAPCAITPKAAQKSRIRTPDSAEPPNISKIRVPS